MSNQELHYLTVSELAPLLRDKKVSPVELLQACLERIHALDGTFHSFITLMEESAVKEAEESERALASGDYSWPAARHTHWAEGPLLHQGRGHHGGVAHPGRLRA